MFAVGYMDVGDEATALSFFRKGYANALNGAFGVWQETPHGGAVNFLTGAGGFLQSVIFGYGGVRLSDDALLLHPPAPPGSATSVKLHGVDFLGAALAVTVTADDVTVERMAAGGAAVGVQPVRGVWQELKVGAPLTMPRAGGGTVSAQKHS